MWSQEVTTTIAFITAYTKPHPEASHVSIPIAAVFWSQGACDEQHDIHEPPDANASQRQQLTDGGAREPQTESVKSQESKQ